MTTKFHFFYSGVFSNWYRCRFRIGGIDFNSVEQYMMWSKAILFKDVGSAAKIMSLDDPAKIKKLGKKVADFDETVWAEHRVEIVWTGVFAKFSQSEVLLPMIRLPEYRDVHFVEASPTDRVWGVGLSEDNPLIQHSSNWRGLNLLGIVTDRVRDVLKFTV